ncbi:MAG: hypothetical protein Kow0088_10770 [Anaerolineales bacterium]
MKNRLDTDRLLSLGLGLLSLIALYVLFQQAAGEAGWFWPRRYLAVLLLVMGSLLIHFVIFFLSPDRRRFLLSKLDEKLGRLAVGAILIALILSGTAYLVYGPYGQPFVEPIARFWLFAQTAWVVSVLINVAHWMQVKKFLHGWVLLLAGFAFNLGYFLFKVSTHPFSLDWSETSRYYYASLFFSERIYGLKAAWSPLHPSRYLLQAIPFFLHPLPLWVHRLWQVLLWVWMPAATAWLLVRRLQLQPYRRLAWLYGYLFLMIGAVYYHLLVIPALILAFYPSRKAGKWANFLFGIGYLFASIWAGISRINWLPMPAILLVTLYLLERTVREQKLWRYLFPPFVLSLLSFLVAVLSSAAYVKLSGNPATYFTSSFTSDLIWQRLLPNPTYYTGILLPIIFVSLPALLSVLFVQRRMGIRLGWLRSLCLTGILLALFVVGIIVSAKIGGGSNLHNFDGYLVVLLILVFYCLSGNVENEAQEDEQPHRSILEQVALAEGTHNHWHRLAVKGLFAWLLIAPLPFAVFQGRPVRTYAPDRVKEALDTLSSVVQKAAAENKEVLLITERHLLTFGYLPNVPLVADYEKVWLMEMAMANHREYLEKFYADLAQRRFAVIVTTQTYVSPQGDSGRFGDENRAWRKRVNRPLLCYYKPYLRFREFNFEIVLPREQVHRRCR